ncbi:MAG: class II aldolase/adducin family protein [Alsobacter sp.]
MEWTYSSKARPDDVLVNVRTGTSPAIRRNLVNTHNLIACYGERFGFSTVVGPCDRGAQAISHVIHLEDCPFDSDRVFALGEFLKVHSSISIAFAYPSDRVMWAAEDLIEQAKRKFGRRLNVLFPDETVNGWKIVSDQKIADNAVCDTVRVKYEPVHVGKCIKLSQCEQKYFSEASRIFEREGLYLRAPSDGYIALRRDNGFLITATRTDKVGLDLDRISWVRVYERSTNRLFYEGAYLPSSDSVEAAVLLAAKPDIQSLIHTHASRLFTRNPAYVNRILVPALAYGEPELGDALVSAIPSSQADFLIMKDHGEIFAGADPIGLLDFISDACRVARATL